MIFSICCGSKFVISLPEQIIGDEVIGWDTFINSILLYSVVGLLYEEPFKSLFDVFD
jgi:hypothetical protein